MQICKSHKTSCRKLLTGKIEEVTLDIEQIPLIMKTAHSKKEPIAVVGIGLRLPGDVNSPDDLWTLLDNKGDAIVDIPSDRWAAAEFLDKKDRNRPGHMVTNQSGFVKDIGMFDPDFFRLNRIEAKCMDPQHRMILETTFRAFEDAGFDIHSYAGSKTGVFAGIFATDYQELTFQASEQMNLNGSSLIGSCLASNRVSYLFDFQGPSLTVDTACSSSMIATHLACNAIWNGECNQAVSCGANALLRPETFMAMSQGGFLSQDCRCKTFDKSANGYVRSEGAGSVLLKPLSQALRDNDKVYACILGTSTNEDGRTNGMPFPSYDAQKDVIADALERSGVNPADIAYVELHGTGTAAGDPIETRSVGDTIACKRKEAGKSLIVGSVKSNIGHGEALSGMSGKQFDD